MRTRRTLVTHSLRDTGDLRVLRAALRGALEPRADNALVWDVVVATQEAVTNSLSAASRPRQRVRVRLRLDGDFAWVEVEDRGPGFQAPATWEERPSLESPHGRGLYLMRALMDVVELDSRRVGSRVRMGKRLGPREPLSDRL